MFWRKAKQSIATDLVGRWTVDPADKSTLAELGDVMLEFDSSHRLTYTIRLPEKDQLMLLTYRLDGDTIITEQPSHPDEQRSNYKLDGDRLMIAFDGQQSYFMRD